MKVPMKWLKRYVNIETEVLDYANKMLMTGLEVEEWEQLGENIKNVVVGRIEKMEKHPDADKLQVCQINVGLDTIQIVTGAPNAYVGMVVPVAVHGAKLPGDVTIKKGKLRGVESMGMMCSGKELNITDEDYPGAEVDGLLDLPGHIEPGTDIRDVLGLNDVVIDFKAYANRPDCMSVIGIARESAVTLNTELNLPEIITKLGKGDVKDYLSVEVRDDELCPRYMARVIKDVKIEPSPEWMQSLLRGAGVRPINNIVDITNYVMLETGQPMHAFDYRLVRGKTIIVRRALKDEQIMTLDGKQRVLNDEMLVIADTQGPVAIAGIMGGEHSGIMEDTATVVFESAKFLGTSIRVTGRALGMRSEASLRFEKGVDIVGVSSALDRAIQLVQELDAGTVIEGTIDVHGEMEERRHIQADIHQINRLLGMEISGDKMAEILNRLEIVTTIKDNILHCTVPSFRMDIGGAADIAEEILRIYGFEYIPYTLVQGSASHAGRNPRQRTELKINQWLQGMGLSQTLTYSLIGPGEFDKLALPTDHPWRNAMRLINPLGEEMSILRTTMLPTMLTVAANNLRNRNHELQLYEIAKVYVPQAQDKLPDEQDTLIILISGNNTDFYVLKGMVESLLQNLNIQMDFTTGGEDCYHPGRKAIVTIGDDHIPAGIIGQIHPSVAQNYEIRQPVYTAEINISKVLDAQKPVMFHAPNRYPSINRDLAVLVSREQEVGPMMKAIEQAGGALLESLTLFDVYQGDRIEAGMKSVAFSMVFRAQERTLVETEAQELFDEIVNALNEQFSATLRGS